MLKNIDEIHGLLFHIGLYERYYALNDAQKAFFHLRNFNIWSEMSGDTIDMLFRYEERMLGTIAALNKVNNHNLANELQELSNFYKHNIKEIEDFEEYEDRITFIIKFKDFKKLQEEINDFIYQNEDIYFENYLEDMNENLSLFEDISKEIEFWDFIYKYNYEGYDVKRAEDLKYQTTETLIQWRLLNSYFYKKAHLYNIWCAAEIVRNGCSDDSFHYFRNWLILQGYDIYKKALENADSLLPILQRKRYQNRDDIQAESFGNEIDKELLVRGIDDFNIWINQNNLSFYQPEIIENDYEHLPDEWLEDENSLEITCPNIYQFFRKNPLPYPFYKK